MVVVRVPVVVRRVERVAGLAPAGIGCVELSVPVPIPLSVPEVLPGVTMVPGVVPAGAAPEEIVPPGIEAFGTVPGVPDIVPVVPGVPIVPGVPTVPDTVVWAAAALLMPSPSRAVRNKEEAFIYREGEMG